jgi:hypothetical protein
MDEYNETVISAHDLIIRTGHILRTDFLDSFKKKIHCKDTKSWALGQGGSIAYMKEMQYNLYCTRITEIKLKKGGDLELKTDYNSQEFEFKYFRMVLTAFKLTRRVFNNADFSNIFLARFRNDVSDQILAIYKNSNLVLLAPVLA